MARPTRRRLVKSELPPPFNSGFEASFILTLGGSSWQGPFLVPPAWSDTVTPGTKTLVLNVLNVVAPTADEGPVDLPGVSMFEMSVVTLFGAPQARITLPITAVLPATQGSDPEPISDSVYQALFDDFVALRTALDALEGTTLVPDGAATACVRVASNLPLRVDQVLRFRYILDASTRWIDLWPGMQLALAPSSFSLFDINYGSLATTNNAYSGSGHLLVRRARGGALQFSPFLASLNSVAPTAGVPRNPAAIAGYLDFGSNALRQRLARLIYPEQIPPANPEMLGTPDITNSVTLVSADSYADLTNATDAVLKNTATPSGTQRAFLTTRTGVSVRIAIDWMGGRQWAELGTTLWDLIRQETIATRGDLFDGLGVTAVAMDRWTQASLLDTYKFPSEIALRPFPIVFDDAAPTDWPADALDPYDLPVLGGDDGGLYSDLSPGGAP